MGEVTAAIAFIVIGLAFAAFSTPFAKYNVWWYSRMGAKNGARAFPVYRWGYRILGGLVACAGVALLTWELVG